MGLPSGYKWLRYIQSNGTQYIDTGFHPNQDTRVFCDVVFVASSTSYWLFGARNGNQDSTFGFLTYDNKYRSDFNTSTDEYLTGVQSGRFTIDKDRNVTKINGQTAKTTTAGTFQCTHNLYLLANNNNGTVGGQCTATLYSCKIYNNGALVRDFIPCQKPDGTIGLWDDVNMLFYGNAGAGTFTAGPVIAIAINKSEITELEYIQGSGTQYINTEIMPNQDTRLDLQASFTQTGSHTIVGADLGWTANGFSIGVGFAHYGTDTSNINGMNDGLMHLISMDKNTLSVDGVSVHAFSAQTFFVGYPLVLFANNRSGSIEEITTMTLCSSQIYDNGTIVRNYIPCQTTSGEIGLWDALNKMFYRNAGTGTFVGGPIKANSLNLRVNIGGAWKDANEAFVNIGGTWKTVEAAFVNIDGTWKELG